MRATYNPIPNAESHHEVDILETCPCENWAKIRTDDGRVKWVMTHYIRIKPVQQDAIKFKILRSSHYSPSYLTDNIFTDWRCFDDKAIETGDRLKIVNDDGNHLANGTVLWVKQTTFGSLGEEDKKGHMEFNNSEDMYSTYQKYYASKITAETPVKVLRIQIDQD